MFEWMNCWINKRAKLCVGSDISVSNLSFESYLLLYKFLTSWKVGLCRTCNEEVKLYDFPGDGGDSLTGTQPHIVTAIRFSFGWFGAGTDRLSQVACQASPWGQVLTPILLCGRSASALQTNVRAGQVPHLIKCLPSSDPLLCACHSSAGVTDTEGSWGLTSYLALLNQQAPGSIRDLS